MKKRHLGLKKAKAKPRRVRRMEQSTYPPMPKVWHLIPSVYRSRRKRDSDEEEVAATPPESEDDEDAGQAIREDSESEDEAPRRKSRRG